MGYGVYYQDEHERWAGYGVPAICDWPTCDADIDRGPRYECPLWCADGEEVPHECGLFFCRLHARNPDAHTLAACGSVAEAKPDTREWIEHVLTDPSWYAWRDINPDHVARLRASLREARDD